MRRRRFGRRPMSRDRRRRTFAIAAAAVGAALLLAAGGMVAVTSATEQSPKGAPSPQTERATAVIERGDLSLTATLDGSIGFGAAEPVSVKAKGTITWLPAPGSDLGRGATALRVDDRPVPVLIGKTALYRPLTSWGMTGADVSMVAENLMELGYLRRADSKDARTNGAFRTAVRAWQTSLGLERTGDIAPTDVVVLTADSRVAKVTARLGDAATGTPFTASTTTRIVEAAVPAGDAGLVGAGAAAEIELPDGRVLKGTIRDVGTAGEGAQSQVRATVEIADQKAVADLDAGAVVVRVVTKTVTDVLIAPVPALIALAEGGYALQDESGRLHAVTIGLIADGRVEVAGDGITADMTVVTAR